MDNLRKFGSIVKKDGGLCLEYRGALINKFGYYSAGPRRHENYAGEGVATFKFPGHTVPREADFDSNWEVALETK